MQLTPALFAYASGPSPWLTVPLAAIFVVLMAAVIREMTGRSTRGQGPK